MMSFAGFLFLTLVDTGLFLTGFLVGKNVYKPDDRFKVSEPTEDLHLSEITQIISTVDDTQYKTTITNHKTDNEVKKEVNNEVYKLDL